MRKTALILGSLALAACAQQQGGVQSYGDNALAQAESLAFQQVDARLQYADAHIGYDGSGCSLYRGIASNGLVRHEMLRQPSGRPICDSRRVDEFFTRWLTDSAMGRTRS